MFYYLGLQNGLTSKYSGSIIRTTHVTGTVTDIGLLLGRMAIGQWKDMWKLKLLSSLWMSFFLGGVVGSYFHSLIGSYTMLLNSIFFLIIGILYSIIIGRELHIPFWRGLLGFYERISERQRAARERPLKMVFNPLQRHE